ncbi:ParB-like nuclease family protein [Actinomadura pelletieri DSM 43383]|uniref:ParB-like nuclease family protein n=1 Tax=Actinomadura pelletieri DSM 43383 TaxID=1120940 RepID=A0A495QAG2_9ACTN|nr:ParB N-terminal domain-containing protein [Actinomadura pelletieri]RKS68296.1 ParB-like nuclease family protein [Actinomadura pelletieri DSM 43383]
MSGDGTGTTSHDTEHDAYDQVFVLLGWAWDVATAARASTRYTVTHAPVSTIGALGALIRIDADYAATVDLSRPLLAVPLPGSGTPLVIDGWHRIHKAQRTGVTELPVILLNADDERACRLMGGSVRRRW